MISNSENQPIKSKISGLSIKSIEFKKQLGKKNNEKSFINKPFTNKKLIKYWGYYLNKIEVEGKQNILSILKMDLPKIINDFNIEFEVENSINKIELTKELDSILPYLKENLNNEKINFNIIVNPKHEKKIFLTPIEKYKKMKSINPNIDMLKKSFDLDF